MRSIKVGDKIRPKNPKNYNWARGMDSYIGTVMTVASVNGRGVRCKEDGRSYFWNTCNFDRILLDIRIGGEILYE